ncbi:DUF2860 family protein, partial [Photobacterium sp. OFAV2-7]|uniref:DUF2860 family protein n=1 Tax=Photobacterium sp. OFAV2-7 TaxID=2917748 RepID=UPI001EF54A91
VRYTFGQNNNHQLFVGTSRSDIITGVFALEVGYKIEVQPESTLAFSVLPTIINGETWADPFITDKARKETDVKGNVYRINYENILHTGLSADIAYYDKEIDNEESGKELFGSANSSLNRNGHGYYSKLSMPLYYDGTTLLTPAFLYQHFSADGKAISHDKYGLNLTYVRFIGRHSFALSGDATITSFNELHPVFNKEQEDKGYSVSVSYEYDKFLNMNDWSFNIVLGYDRTASNIDFYEETQYYSTLGVSYHF